MALIVARSGRGITKDITLLNAADEAIVPVSADKIRAYIGRDRLNGSDLASAELLVTSDAATANGSSFTKNSPSSGLNRLRLDASDLDFDPGTYTLYIDFLDSVDTSEWKAAGRHVFVLEPS